MIRIGVIGCGYWGPNIIRNFLQMPQVDMRKVADLSTEQLKRIQNLYPKVGVTTDYRQLITDPEIDAIAIATPVNTHKGFTMEALANGKHVFVEKPLAGTIADVEAMVESALQKNLQLMVGHTFEYHAAVHKMKEIIDSGLLGDIYYVNSQRLNLGLFQKDINVVWDLAPHDISVILMLLGKEPKHVTSIGVSHINPSIEDVATTMLEFDDNVMAFIQTSWLDPNKVRKMTVVGSKKMLVYDDIQANEKIWIYDKGVEIPERYDTFGDFQYAYHYGDIVIPRIENKEPLRTELSHFVHCIEKDTCPISDGINGLRVVKILEAAQRSIKQGGIKVNVNNLFEHYN